MTEYFQAQACICHEQNIYVYMHIYIHRDTSFFHNWVSDRCTSTDLQNNGRVQIQNNKKDNLSSRRKKWIRCTWLVTKNVCNPCSYL